MNLKKTKSWKPIMYKQRNNKKNEENWYIYKNIYIYELYGKYTCKIILINLGMFNNCVWVGLSYWLICILLYIYKQLIINY